MKKKSCDLQEKIIIFGFFFSTMFYFFSKSFDSSTISNSNILFETNLFLRAFFLKVNKLGSIDAV